MLSQFGTPSPRSHKVHFNSILLRPIRFVNFGLDTPGEQMRDKTAKLRQQKTIVLSNQIVQGAFPEKTSMIVLYL